MKDYTTAVKQVAQELGARAHSNLLEGYMDPWSDINLHDAALAISIIYGHGYSHGRVYDELSDFAQRAYEMHRHDITKGR